MFYSPNHDTYTKYFIPEMKCDLFARNGLKAVHVRWNPMDEKGVSSLSNRNLEPFYQQIFNPLLIVSKRTLVAVCYIFLVNFYLLAIKYKDLVDISKEVYGFAHLLRLVIIR